MGSQVAIQATNISHQYGTQQALRSISFELPVGARCGLIGPDGAGKSSLLGLISGVKILQKGELSVLEMLMMRAGKVVTKQQIVNSLSAWDADFSENAVEVYIYRLRRRLEGTGAAIQTVRGFGYLLDTDAALG